MSWLKRVDWRFVAFGLLAYITFLVLTFPAERVYAYWQSQAGPRAGFALGGVAGSIWSGHADAALVDGQRLEAVSWRLHPLALLAGRVAADLSIEVENGFVRGDVSASLGGALSVDAVEARLPMTQIPSKALAALRPAGTLNLNLRNVEWSGAALVSAEGRLVWSGAGINLFQNLELGDLAVDLETTDGEVKGVLADAGGPLQASGVLSLKDDGSYQFTGTFAARGNDPKLTQALRTLGRVGPDGKVQVSQTGSLASLGLVSAKR